MEVGILLRSFTPANLLLYLFTARRCSTMASLIPQGSYRGPKPKREWVMDLVLENDDLVRSFPIYVGGISIVAVLFKRTVSGIAPAVTIQKAVILQPLGDKGLAAAGGDTIRGFTISDQAWITLIGEKFDATLTKVSSETPLTVQLKS